MKRIDSIQILRGVAAVFILLFHLKFIGHGEFAVDIFFCISGFILMYKTQKNDKNMLLKRLVRILPLYYIFTFVMFFVIKLFPSLSLMSSATASNLFKSLLFIPYISSGADMHEYVVPIVSIGWTLNLEMYFYIIFTIANKISVKFRGIITSALLSIVAIIGFIYVGNDLIIKFITNSVIIEFILGIIGFYIYNFFKDKQFNKYLRILLLCISIISILMLWHINGNQFFANVRIARYGILSFMCFMCFILALKDVKIPTKMLALGKISYSFYYVEFFVSAVVNKILISSGTSVIWKFIYLLLSIILTAIISYISWYLIEKKFGNYIRKKIIKVQ